MKPRSDASGAYAFASLPQIEGASLRAALDGYRIAEQPLPAASTFPAGSSTGQSTGWSTMESRPCTSERSS